MPNNHRHTHSYRRRQVVLDQFLHATEDFPQKPKITGVGDTHTRYPHDGCPESCRISYKACRCGALLL
jgi:hypothetical protein